MTPEQLVEAGNALLRYLVELEFEGNDASYFGMNSIRFSSDNGCFLGINASEFKELAGGLADQGLINHVRGSYVEFSDTEKKIDLYSATITSENRDRFAAAGVPEVCLDYLIQS